MTNPFTAPTISGYNASPPSDDGANTATNEVKWSTHKTKLADPIKNYADAISSAVSTAFGSLFLNAVSSHSADYTVVSGDRAKLLSCTNTITITLLAAGTAADGFPLAITNAGSGVITVDGNAAETVLGAATVTLNPGDLLIIVCDGSNWQGTLIGRSGTKAAATGYTRLTPNYCISDMGYTASTNDPLGSGTTITRDTYSAITAPSTDCTAIEFAVSIMVGSANSTSASRSANVIFATDNIGTTSLAIVTAKAAEQAAVTAGNPLVQVSGIMVKVKLHSPGDTIYVALTDDAGNQGAARYQIVGYYD